MDDSSPYNILALARATGATIADSATPHALRDKLILIVAQLRDSLTGEQSRMVDAAEAEAVISSFASEAPIQFRLQLGAENPLDDLEANAEGQAILQDNQ